MKGIAHFAIGVAVAACFPEAVRAGAAGNPLYFLLGGVCGLLPDSLDFKLGRFLHRHDVEVTPDPLRPDARLIADAVAAAVNRAHASGEAVRIKLNTIRLGTDLWQSYTVALDVARREVRVLYGPKVDTGAQPVHAPPTASAKAGARLNCAIRLDYFAAVTVDIFDGPVFCMTPLPGSVRAAFQPWHRRWTHSLVTGLIPGLAAGAGAGLTAGLVATLAWWAHIVADQLGFMGSALAFPFRHRRFEGLKVAPSTEAGPSLAAVALSVLVIYWRLHVEAHPGADPLGFLAVLFFGFVVPAASYLGLRRLLRRYGSGERNTR